MGAAIRHRGPDSTGTWADPSSGYAVTHQRLSIVDVSADGAQPMASHDGRWILAYNGEAYNFSEIRAELDRAESIAWRGHSDTEVLLEAIAAWGLQQTLNKIVGMFAFALWDTSQRELTLVRDRFGQKPLYICWLEGGGIAFGSEIKALRQHPRFPHEIDRKALGEFIRCKCIPGAMSIYQRVHKLPPGCSIRLDGNDTCAAPDRDMFRKLLQPYWSIDDVYHQALSEPFLGSIDEADKHLEELLNQAVACRMVADVPLGAFLSGGIDSSLVVALMQANSGNPVKTYSIGYHDKRFNEAGHAKQIAQYLGTDHTEWILSPRDSLEAIPLMPVLFDEPFAAVSQVPTYLVAKLARKDVTVTLSGDGGDEMFGGYHRHLWAPKLAAMLRFPRPIRRAAGAALQAASPCTWSGVLPTPIGATRFGEKMCKLAGLMPARDFGEVHDRLSSFWPDGGLPVVGAGERPNQFPPPHPSQRRAGLSRAIMAYDAQTFLPDSVLVKVDRTSMAVSLEARAPLLDHRLAEFSFRLPMNWMIKDGVGKLMLRRILYKHVPQALIERPKMGFGMPVADWLRKDLRAWADSLLDTTRIKQDGFFDPKPIERLWRDHQRGTRNAHDQIWPILMFQAWLDTQRT